MKFDDVYELSNKMDGIFLTNMLDIFFPNEHGAYYMLSEGGDECCLDELSKEIGGDYEMPTEFDQLIECYEKHYDNEEYDKIQEFVESCNPQ